MNPTMFCLLATICWQIDKPADYASAGATFCQIYQPVYIHPTDTRRTKEQVDSLNRVWKELCKPKP